MTHNHHRFAKVGLWAAALLLAGCTADSGSGDDASTSSENGSDTDVQSAERQTMAETAWLSVSADGAVHITYLDADGQYRDTSGGKTVFTGNWDNNAQGALCFTPDQGTGACWTHGSAGSDGVMRATDGAGRDIELKRVTYSPPAAASETAEQSGGD